ncbi:unnamed protein product [Didymodactylos carnosus]|uniref:RNA-dependent RNA polymerase n=1 Tax=Didymodactylos carnosus TaxID=1234261 RepID=A0A816D9L5_9BILA|nr:unnamed protein product [Didymodactylos carnosus]CAF4534760.1 unnamed protein product [Didymodactylos carnosus]
MRAHIQIDKSKARYMFGIIDEYDVLEYGQVFVQYSNMDSKNLLNTTVLTGPVTITKNPCHHPGDLRTFNAVDRQELRHLHDCIVFPAKGPRPDPNEIARSDLDGDEYTVIKDEDLVPLMTENAMPYDYDAGIRQEKLDRPITKSDIIGVVLNICEQDNIGRLSNLHLAYSDKKGLDHPETILIAAGISKEVDAVKTGYHPYTEYEIIQLNKALGNERPDHMECKSYKSYPSKTILGMQNNSNTIRLRY